MSNGGGLMTSCETYKTCIKSMLGRECFYRNMEAKQGQKFVLAFFHRICIKSDNDLNLNFNKCPGGDYTERHF